MFSKGYRRSKARISFRVIGRISFEIRAEL